VATALRSVCKGVPFDMYPRSLWGGRERELCMTYVCARFWDVR